MFNNYQKQQERQDINNLQAVFKNFYNLQQQPELQHILQITKTGSFFYNANFAKDMPIPVKLNSAYFDSFRHQCERIILRNQKIKENILVVRSKLQQLQNVSSAFKPAKSFRQEQEIEKIKQLSTQIKSKLMMIKQRRFLKNEMGMKEQEKTMNRQQMKLSQKILPSAQIFGGMKKGVQFMSRSTAGLKYDLEATAKYLEVHRERNKSASQDQRF